MKKKEKLKNVIALNSPVNNSGVKKLSLNKDIITLLTNGDSSTLRVTISEKVCACPIGSFTLPCPTSRHAVCGTVETWEQPYCTLC